MEQRSDLPTPTDAPAPAVASPRRRRLLQAGVVPVGLTLASRPVMAWHCNTTSAWGSAVLRNGGASVKARADAAILRATECWTIANWCDNTVRSDVSASRPWTYVAAGIWAGQNKSENYARNNLLIGHLFPSGLSGCSNTEKVLSVLTNNKTTFKGYMVVARLNTMYAGHRVNECLLSNGEDMVVEMAKTGPGKFKPRNSTGAAWTESEILTYLYANYIVR
jgi:hypothetical protein